MTMDQSAKRMKAWIHLNGIITCYIVNSTTSLSVMHDWKSFNYSDDILFSTALIFCYAYTPFITWSFHNQFIIIMVYALCVKPLLLDYNNFFFYPLICCITSLIFSLHKLFITIATAKTRSDSIATTLLAYPLCNSNEIFICHTMKEASIILPINLPFYQNAKKQLKYFFAQLLIKLLHTNLLSSKQNLTYSDLLSFVGLLRQLNNGL